MFLLASHLQEGLLPTAIGLILLQMLNETKSHEMWTQGAIVLLCEFACKYIHVYASMHACKHVAKIHALTKPMAATIVTTAPNQAAQQTPADQR